jgi:hypothetical protein
MMRTGFLLPQIPWFMPVSVLLQPKNPPIAANTCFHCHDVCPPVPPGGEDRLRIGDKHFCCQGCQMVYEILNTHNLCEFYDLDKKCRTKP